MVAISKYGRAERLNQSRTSREVSKAFSKIELALQLITQAPALADSRSQALTFSS